MMFLVTVVGLRITFKNQWIKGPLQTALFEIDVFQHQARAIVGDDAQNMVIAEELLVLSFFSPIYLDAGVDMLRGKADEGYAPAIDRLVLLENPPVQ